MKTLAALLVLLALWSAGELAISYYSQDMAPSCTTDTDCETKYGPPY